MKVKIIALFLCIFTINVMAQTQISREKCKTCGKPISQCPQKGNHSEAAGYDVTFNCNVSNAVLYIDENAYGEVSGVRFLKTGLHTIKLVSPEYEEYKETIYVDSRHLSFSFIMKQKQQASEQIIEQAVVEEVQNSTVDFLSDATKDITFDDINQDFDPQSIESIRINGKLFYYATIPNHPDCAVIVAKKGAYEKLQELILPESFQTRSGETAYIVGIGKGAFVRCTVLKTVNLPKTVLYIGDAAFVLCGVEKLNLEKGIKVIGKSAFWGTKISDIILPDGLEVIKEGAFSCFLSEKEVENGKLSIPLSVSSIGKSAFCFINKRTGFSKRSIRKILSLPDFVGLDNCKEYGINTKSVEEYLSK